MTDGTPATSLPLVSFADEVLVNNNPGTGMEGPKRITKENFATQLSTLIDFYTAIVSVLDKDLATPPVSPTTGDRYIVAATPAGAWVGHTNDIAEWTGAAWSFTAPGTGAAALIQDEFELYGWNATAVAWQTITLSPLAFSTYALLAAVTGAPANIEAQVLNETETTTISRARASNVATIVLSGLLTPVLAIGQMVNIATVGGTGYNGTVVLTGVTTGGGNTTITYASTGGDEGTTADTAGRLDREGVYASDGAGAWTWISPTNVATLTAQMAALEATETIGVSPVASGTPSGAGVTYSTRTQATLGGYVDTVEIAVNAAQKATFITLVSVANVVTSITDMTECYLEAGVNKIAISDLGLKIDVGNLLFVYLPSGGLYIDTGGGGAGSYQFNAFPRIGSTLIALATNILQLRYTISGTLKATRDAIKLVSQQVIRSPYLAKPTVSQFAGSELPYWRQALAKLRNGGTAIPRVAFIGDSTSVGVGSIPVITRYRPNSHVARVNRMFGSGSRNFLGSGSITTSPFNQYDLRVGFTGAALTANRTAGGYGLTAVGAGSITFDPDGITDTCEIFYTPASGTFHLDVDGGGSLGTSDTGSDNALARMVVNYSRGVHRINLTFDNNGSLRIFGMNAYDSKVRAPNCLSLGMGGATSGSWNDSAVFYSPLNMLAFLAPVLTIIDLGVNDYATNVALATFNTNMQAIITAALAVGDAVLVTPFETTIGASLPLIDYVNAIKALAVTNSIPCVDFYSRLPHAQAVTLGMVNDASHPNLLGYEEKAGAIFSVIGGS